MNGYLSLDSNGKPLITPIGEVNDADSLYPQINGFRYFWKISQHNDSIYWDVSNDPRNDGAYLLKLDVPNRRLLDSVYICDFGQVTPRFALSSNDSIIYAFILNESCWANTEYGDTVIPQPSFLKIFSTKDLSLLDSIPIPNPVPDSNCASFGYDDWDEDIYDRTGNYLVYFFMGSVAIERFVPAMLFIFDTRTNQATWLRVGWR
jgi:hypothetical protein